VQCDDVRSRVNILFLWQKVLTCLHCFVYCEQRHYSTHYRSQPAQNTGPSLG